MNAMKAESSLVDFAGSEQTTDSRAADRQVDVGQGSGCVAGMVFAPALLLQDGFYSDCALIAILSRPFLYNSSSSRGRAIIISLSEA